MAEISKTEIGFELRKRNCPPNLQPVSDICRHRLHGLRKRKPRAGMTVRSWCRECTSKSKRTPQNRESDRKVKYYLTIIRKINLSTCIKIREYYNLRRSPKLCMKIEEAIVWLLSTGGCGMTAETLAEQINLRRLHRRRDGQPVGTNQIWAVVFQNPDMFVQDGKFQINRVRIIAFSAYGFCKITRFEFLVYVKYRVLKKFCLSLS